MTTSMKNRKRRPRGFGVKAGMSPGTMVFVGDQKLEKALIDVIQYDETALKELHDVAVSQCKNSPNHQASHGSMSTVSMTFP